MLRSTVSSRPLAAAGLAAALVATGMPTPPRLPPAPAPGPTAASCAVPEPTASADLTAAGHIPAPTPLRAGRPARRLLLDLAPQISPDVCDPTSGRYDVVHHRAWDNYHDQQATRDVVRWYADDDSGAQQATRYPGTRSSVTRNLWPPGWLHHEYLSHPYRSTDWLQTQARAQTTHTDEATALLAGLAVLATWHSPRPPQRALTARVLADTPGLTAYPDTIDLAGRTGIGVAATSRDGRERHLLILHPRTAAVLAYERDLLTPAGWQTRVYLLLLTRTHAPPNWSAPTPNDTPPPPQPDRRIQPRHSDVWLTLHPRPCTTDPTPGRTPR